MRKKLLTHIFSASFILCCLWPARVAAGDIVYPWRAVSAFVKAGNSLGILYNNIDRTKIDSVILAGPFHNIRLSIDSVNAGSFEYDSYTRMDVNNIIWVHVKESTPEELYDLVVHSGGHIDKSPKSVKVVEHFRSSHCFIHISDLHISRQWVGSAENGYAKELELFDSFVKVANIIAPDFVIITGDIIHHYTRFDADSTGWGGYNVYRQDQRPSVEEKYMNCFEGAKGFSGIHGLNAPAFAVAGNHDFYGLAKEDHFSKSAQWNRLCGKRVFGFSYAGTRIVAADDNLGDPVIDIPNSSPMSGLQGDVLEKFLKENGPGSVRIMAQHRPDRMDTLFLNENKIDILLNGHHHDPFHEYVGATPTLSIRPGAVCRSGEIRDWEKKLGFFRIFYVDENGYTYTPALRFCRNPTLAYQDLEPNLSLTFQSPNDGSSNKNSATIRNSFPVDLPQCKIRFVMKKGEYVVAGARIEQIIQTGPVTVVDVRTPVNANNNKMVAITGE